MELRKESVYQYQYGLFMVASSIIVGITIGGGEPVNKVAHGGCVVSYIIVYGT